MISTDPLDSKRSNSEKTLQYYQQCMTIWQDRDCTTGQGGILNNIVPIYPGQIDLAKTVELLKQDLATCRWQGDRDEEAVSYWNIGLAYKDMSDFVKAEEYIALSVELMQTVEHPQLGICRDYLELLRAKRWWPNEGMQGHEVPYLY